ncbi:MAG: PAS domain-containing sensor histidine kinase [Bryobacteraceae bacterium]
MQIRQLKQYAIFFIDLDGRIRTWNAGVEHLLGYSEIEWIGSHACVIFTPADKAVELCNAEMTIAREQGWVSDIRWHRKKDGTEFFANGVISATYDESHTLIGFTKIVSDETSRKQLQDSLIESNSALEQFAFAASHDLQEPLRTIGSYAELIVRVHGGELNQEGSEWLDFIVKAVERMNVLIRDLLLYARVGVEKETAVSISLDQDVESATSQLARAIEESGAAVTHDPLPTVMAERSQITRLFLNLIGNAIKYRSPDRPPQIHISARPDEKYWIISVEDNGVGFEQQYAEAIFSPFKRLHGREYPGSGVGLAICRRIVERYGGRIWAESTVGRGSVFYLKLPQGAGDEP